MIVLDYSGVMSVLWMLVPCRDSLSSLTQTFVRRFVLQVGAVVAETAFGWLIDRHDAYT